MTIDRELAELDARFAQAEKLWSGGKRSFGAGDGGLGDRLPNYACKADAVTRNLPVCPAIRKDTSGKIVTEHGRQIRITEDGRKTTLGGRAIIDSKEQRQAHIKRWGLLED